MYSLFTEKNSESSVIERLGNCSNERFKKVMSSAIRHLHAFIKEIEPTMEEWRKAMDIDKMVLCAHSLGAYMSAIYALKYPQVCAISF